MKKLFALFILLASLTPAFAEHLPVKDRCSDPDVMKTALQTIEEFYPPRYGDRASFIFDPETILTESYDENLDKVKCRAQIEIIVELVDSQKKPWVLAANKLGIASMTKFAFYTMQYVSGTKIERFNVKFEGTGDIDMKMKKK